MKNYDIDALFGGLMRATADLECDPSETIEDMRTLIQYWRPLTPKETLIALVAETRCQALAFCNAAAQYKRKREQDRYYDCAKTLADFAGSLKLTSTMRTSKAVLDAVVAKARRQSAIYAANARGHDNKRDQAVDNRRAKTLADFAGFVERGIKVDEDEVES